MQLIVILAALVAVNVGIVYVGSEAYEEEHAQQQGVVEVEDVENPSEVNSEEKTEAAPETQEQPQ